MPTCYLISSPPRLQHLDVQVAPEDIHAILPEILGLRPDKVSLTSCSLAWRGYRELDEFVLDKSLVLEVECLDLDALLYTQLLAESGTIGDILLYIIDKKGGNSVCTVLVVDSSQDDVVLSQITKESALALVDGFYIKSQWHVDGDKLYTVKGHFMELDHKSSSARTSYLFTKLAELGLDVRLLLMDWDCRVFYVSGTLNAEVPEERWIEDKKFEVGSMEELMDNLQKEE